MRRPAVLAVLVVLVSGGVTIRAGELAPGIDLVSIGTLGDLPPEESRLVVNVDREGRILFAEDPLSIVDLRRLLRTRADGDREEAPGSPSRLDLVLRIDRTVPWSVVQWLTHDAVMLNIARIHFSVRPSQGGPEGVLSLRTAIRPLRGDPEPRPNARVVIPIRVLAAGEGSRPIALGTLFREAKLEVHPRVAIARAVPTGYAIRVLAAICDAGGGEITLVGAPPPIPPMDDPFRDEVRRATSDRHTPTIEALGRPVPDVGRDAVLDNAAAPAVRRIRVGFAARLWFSERTSQDDVSEWRNPRHTKRPLYQHRIRRKGLRMRGGDGETERAVARGLDWLHRHQSSDGRWRGSERGTGRSADVRLTGAALLAYLGYGETGWAGRFREPVSKGLSFLRASQDETGAFVPRASERFTFDHACATMALVEAYDLIGDPRDGARARRAVRLLETNLPPATTGAHPVDVAWPAAALAAARRAGLPAGQGAIRRARTLAAGSVFARCVFADPWRKAEVDACVAHARALLTALDRPIALGEWHLGSLAIARIGGESWRDWNRAMKKTLRAGQCVADDLEGSWNPDASTRERVMATALACLTLEVYYRFP